MHMQQLYIYIYIYIYFQGSHRYHYMNAILDLMTIGRVNMSLWILVGANRINGDAQKWLFEEVANMQHMRLE